MEESSDEENGENGQDSHENVPTLSGTSMHDFQ
jgi:hypothetical protein